MTGWWGGPVPVSRAMALAWHREDVAAWRAERERQEALQARQEEREARARAYYAEHGEWEWQTTRRALDIAAQRERAAQEKADRERAERQAEWQQAQYAQMIASGRQPRTVSQVLAAVALFP